MIAENEDILTEQKPPQSVESSSLLRTLISLALFIAVDYWIFRSWGAVALLVSVIFIHESGHFIAMKIFGYKGINMTFVPFMGAYVSGEATHFSKFKKIIMLFAGPIPGIIIGMILLSVYQQNFNQLYYLAALAFLLLNVFNLLPVSPMDGGQIIETMFFSGNLLIQFVFLSLSLLLTIYFLVVFKIWVLVLVGWFILMRIISIHLTFKVRKVLDQNNISYDCNYEDLTEEHYTQIRNILVTESSYLRSRFTPGEHSDREGQLISYIEKILKPSYIHDLTSIQKTLLIMTYVLAFILPCIQWMSVKGWF